MKAIESDANFRITYSMTLDEAHLIFRMCEGYTALARELVKITARFPEDEKTLQAMLFKLADGMGAEIKKAKDARDVYVGRSVAIKEEELRWLQDRVEELKSLKRETEVKRAD